MSPQEDVESIEHLLNSATPYAYRVHPIAEPQARNDAPVPEEEGMSIDASQMVYVPAHPLVRDGEVVIGYETREIDPGGSVLPVFTSEEKLVKQLSAVQPWVTIKLETLVDLMGAQFLALDPVIDPDAERWTAREAAEHEALIRREMGSSS